MPNQPPDEEVSKEGGFTPLAAPKNSAGDTEYEGMTLEHLRAMSAKAEPGLWWVNDFKVEDGHGQHITYGLANPMGKMICDTMNGDLQVIYQDDGPRYDQAGSDNMEFAAACVNYVRARLAEGK